MKTDGEAVRGQTVGAFLVHHHLKLSNFKLNDQINLSFQLSVDFICLYFIDSLY